MVSDRKHRLQHNWKAKYLEKWGDEHCFVLFCLGSAPSPTSLTDIVLNQNRPKYSTNLNKGSTDPLRTFQWTFQRLKCPMFHSLFAKTDNGLVVKQWLHEVNTALPNTVSKWSPALSNHFYMGKEKKKKNFSFGLDCNPRYLLFFLFS